MKLEVHNGLIKGLPIALLIAFLVQGSALVWWASARVHDVRFLERRVTKLETGIQRKSKIETDILQRLARIEERLFSNRRLLERIDKRIR